MSTPYLFPSPLSLICLSSEHQLENLDFHNIRKKARISPMLINIPTYHFFKNKTNKKIDLRTMYTLIDLFYSALCTWHKTVHCMGLSMERTYAWKVNVIMQKSANLDMMPHLNDWDLEGYLIW